MLIPRRVKHRKQHHPSLKGQASGGTKVTLATTASKRSRVRTSPTARSSLRVLPSTGTSSVAARCGSTSSRPSADQEARRDPHGFGQGSPEWWVAPAKPGRVLFEMSYPNEGDCPRGSARAQHKLPIKTRIVTREERF